MHIRIVAVGKLKEDYLIAAQEEYAKRLSRFSSVEVVELKEEKLRDNASEAEIRQAAEAEGKRIIECVGPQDYVVCLCVEGKQLDSEELAGHIGGLMTSGRSRLTFIIGGSNGLSLQVKRAGDLCLSFSRMTFPHQLFRIILLEQLYRAYKIISNETYHK